MSNPRRQYVQYLGAPEDSRSRGQRKGGQPHAQDVAPNGSYTEFSPNSTVGQFYRDDYSAVEPGPSSTASIDPSLLDTEGSSLQYTGTSSSLTSNFPDLEDWILSRCRYDPVRNTCSARSEPQCCLNVLVESSIVQPNVNDKERSIYYQESGGQNMGSAPVQDLPPLVQANSSQFPQRNTASAVAMGKRPAKTQNTGEKRPAVDDLVNSQSGGDSNPRARQKVCDTVALIKRVFILLDKFELQSKDSYHEETMNLLSRGANVDPIIVTSYIKHQLWKQQDCSGATKATSENDINFGFLDQHLLSMDTMPSESRLIKLADLANLPANVAKAYLIHELSKYPVEGTPIPDPELRALDHAQNTWEGSRRTRKSSGKLENGALVCMYCFTSWSLAANGRSNVSEWYRHILEHWPLEVLLCPPWLCLKAFTRKDKFSQHLERDHEPKLLEEYARKDGQLVQDELKETIIKQSVKKRSESDTKQGCAESVDNVHSELIKNCAKRQLNETKIYHINEEFLAKFGVILPLQYRQCGFCWKVFCSTAALYKIHVVKAHLKGNKAGVCSEENCTGKKGCHKLHWILPKPDQEESSLAPNEDDDNNPGKEGEGASDHRSGGWDDQEDKHDDAGSDADNNHDDEYYDPQENSDDAVKDPDYVPSSDLNYGREGSIIDDGRRLAPEGGLSRYNLRDNGVEQKKSRGFRNDQKRLESQLRSPGKANIEADTVIDKQAIKRNEDLASCLRQAPALAIRQAKRRETSISQVLITKAKILDRNAQVFKTTSKAINTVPQIQRKPTGLYFAYKSYGEAKSNAALKANIKDFVTILKTLEHPHLLRLVAARDLHNSCAMIMTPAPEYNLKEYLSNPEMTSSECLGRWTGCLASAIAYLHSSPLANSRRDLKPTNIIVRDDVIFITDLGTPVNSMALALSTSKDLHDSRIYAAPETLIQGSHNMNTDIFSLGCIYLEIANVILGGSAPSWHNIVSSIDDEAAKSKLAQWSRVSAIQQWLIVSQQRAIETFKDAFNHYRDLVERVFGLCKAMLRFYANDRPTADEVARRLPCNTCCGNPVDRITRCPALKGEGPLPTWVPTWGTTSRNALFNETTRMTMAHNLATSIMGLHTSLWIDTVQTCVSDQKDAPITDAEIQSTLHRFEIEVDHIMIQGSTLPRRAQNTHETSNPPIPAILRATTMPERPSQTYQRLTLTPATLTTVRTKDGAFRIISGEFHIIHHSEDLPAHHGVWLAWTDLSHNVRWPADLEKDLKVLGSRLKRRIGRSATY